MKHIFKQLNSRQELILELIEKDKKISVSELIFNLSKIFKKVSRITIIRDLNKLLELKLIKRIGKGRSVIYELLPSYLLFKSINVAEYFETETDKRKIFKTFNFDLLNYIKDIFNVEEKNYLQEILNKYQFDIKKLPANVIKQEFERLTIELSWKSSVIEGNTYTLLETESLIKHGIKAKGHKKEEAIMILNHKYTLDYIRKNLTSFKKISISKLEDIHRLLTNNLNIQHGLRNIPVGITGTIYQPLDNNHQIREALEKTCKIVNQEKNIFSQAVILMLLIAYIQPFVDGNKRTSRLVANAILIANNICPLSYRSVDEEEYKKAVILFYEQNNLNYFKQLFIKQFEFAVKNYFKIK
ncbi:MAG: Fic family protein [Patescibacteria group bacterium]